MTIQPDSTNNNNGSWSWTIQRELDGLQRSTDARFVEQANRIDKLVSILQYDADRRTSDERLGNIQSRITDVNNDLDVYRRESRESFESFRLRIENALRREVQSREAQHAEYLKSQQSRFRFVLSMVLIPIVIAVVTLVMAKK